MPVSIGAKRTSGKTSEVSTYNKVKLLFMITH